MSWHLAAQLTIAICRASTLRPSWHCAADRWQRSWHDNYLYQFKICTGWWHMMAMNIFIRKRPELVGLWLEVCQAISRQLSWDKMLASTRMCLRWFYAHLSCTRAGLICCGSRMVPVHISHVLVNVAKHHICVAGRTSTLGQQSASKPNLATIKYLNIYFFSGFPK